jgi:hypothetical protein
VSCLNDVAVVVYPFVQYNIPIKISVNRSNIQHGIISSGPGTLTQYFDWLAVITFQWNSKGKKYVKICEKMPFD